MNIDDMHVKPSGQGAVMWTLRRVLILIVLISSIAIIGTLVWVSETYQRFAIDTQNKSTAWHGTLLLHEVKHRRSTNSGMIQDSR